ncbi:MAG: type 4a pilus biogenesis protein PilO [Acidobacteria bacterium]|nr:type 4a pilus biogenesis protein PilO [Acidobacteriota bacterium]
MALKDSKLADLPFRTQVLLIAFLLLGISYGFYTYFIAPKREETSLLNSRMNALLNEVQKGQIVEARLPQFKQEITRQREYLDNLRRILPEEKETADIIRKIGQLALESDLQIKSFTPQQTVVRDFYEDWPILIAVEGSYDSLEMFLDKVSRFTRIINVENISIRALENPGMQRTLSATCTATTFVFLENRTQS